MRFRAGQVFASAFTGLWGRRRLGWMMAVTAMFTVQVATVSAHAADVVYVETNDVAGNSVLAFRNDGSGNLTFLDSYPAGGKGVFDSTFSLGPFDSDQNLTISPALRLLFAVNSGSNSIAVFHIHSDGSLEAASGSPFPSGGSDPVSVGVSGDTLVVVNKDEDPAQNANLQAPNYTTFRIWPNGTLTPIRKSTAPVAFGSSPSQASIGAFGHFVFGADFFGGLIQSMRIDDGELFPNPPSTPPSSAYTGITAPHFVLGVRAHPARPFLYVGLVTASKLGVYRLDSEGRLSFVGTATNSGAAICWVIVNTAGRRAYTTNTGDNSISVYDLTEPARPEEIQHYVLASTTGNPFSPILDPSQQFLYVLSERSSATATTAANAIHTLAVDANGTLSEVSAPMILPLTDLTRAQGIAVF